MSLKFQKKGLKMSYIKNTLSKDEEIKEVIKLHWSNYIITGFLTFLAFSSILMYFFDKEIQKDPSGKVGIFFIIIWALYDFLKLYRTEMVVTNKRIICKKGILSTRTEELKTKQIESIEIKQSILGHLFGYATLWFSGTGTSKVKFESIENPWAIKSRIESVIEN
ncbi:MAG: PH domain-containing protein [Alphaproteobacteria bacterium]|nr:PH domain-containing protein [Alphaproteobacteria bacterium]